MTCLEFDRLCVKFMNREICREELRNFYLHLGECADCRAYWESYRAVQSLLLEEKRIA